MLNRIVVKVLPYYDFVESGAVYENMAYHPKYEDGDGLSHWLRYDDDEYQGYDLRLSHCFTKLGGDGYLLGVFGGYLAKINKNNFELCGYGLKNFRLHELRNKAKSR